MKQKSIAAIGKLIRTNQLTKAEIQELQFDERKGIQQLLKTYERKQQQQKEQAKKFDEMWYYERLSFASGHDMIAGIDEAGRGPLAGPVVSAAVILPKDFQLLGLTDSKLLSEDQRDRFFHIITSEAVSYSITSVSNQKIDEINIYEATKTAMKQAVLQLDPSPDYILIDAVEIDGLPFPTQSIIKGDQKSITIAAASILAKVTRDKMMKEIAAEYPAFGFHSHKGYGTNHHLAMLNKHGVTPYHRASFAPIRQLIS